MEKSKYSDGKIYKLTSKNTEKIYLGSTYNELNKRLYNHIGKYNQYIKGTGHYYTAFELLEFEDIEIELIMMFPCNTKKELEQKEGEFIKLFGEKCVNYVVAGRNTKEHYQDNREVYSINNKKYHDINKETIRARHKEYYQLNKEAISEKRKIYYKKKQLLPLAIPLEAGVPEGFPLAI